MPGILNKLLRRKESAPAQEEVPASSCPHAVLTPHWDDLSNMGNEEKATSFSCASCGTVFSVAEAQALRESEADRLRQGATKTCPHNELRPQWDDPANEGNDDLVSGYVCSVCNMRFTPAEAQTLHAVE